MINKILDILYPRRCVLCLSRCPPDPILPLDLCPACQADLPRLQASCQQCAIPLPADLNASLCGQCQQKAPRFDQALCVYHYAQPLEWLIQQMKFHRKPLIARLLAELMAQSIASRIQTLPDVIIPVPLHFKRQRERGYNQAEELARVIAHQLNVPLDNRFLERILPSQKQSGLDARQRRKNVKNVFRVKPASHHYRHVAVVDDVMSTGSTLNEISRVLKQQGITTIEVWLLARASLD